MAYAEKTTREVKTEVDVIRLDLSRAEAEALRVVCAFVGGNPLDSPRRHIDSIIDALDEIIGNDSPDDYLYFDAYKLISIHTHHTSAGIQFNSGGNV